MTFSIIQKSQLEGAQRIDAEYYQPEFLKLINQLKKTDHKNLRDIGIIKSGTTPKDRDSNLESGTILLKTSDIRNNVLPTESEYFYINDIIDERMKSTRLRSGDVLINIVGATLGVIGRVGFIPVNFAKANITQAMALVRIENDLIKPGYLFAYMRSKYGRCQLDRLARPTEQFNINLEELGRVTITVLPGQFQQDVEDIISQSYEHQENASYYYRRAEDLLLEELGLKDFDDGNDLFSIVQYRDIVTANRNDAEFYQTKYRKLKDRLKGKIKSLTSLIDAVQSNFDPIREPEKEFNYVELANINSSIGIIDGSERVIGKEAPSRARRILKDGDVIVSSIEGSLEKVALVSKEQEGYLASTGFFQFRSNKITSEVLLVLMKSIVMQWQLKQNCAGTILTAVPNEALNKMYIPILPQPVKQKIADLVRKSHSARQKSKELLEEAKRKVEEMIEKGGE